MINLYKYSYRLVFLCFLVFTTLSCLKETDGVVQRGEKTQLFISAKSSGYADGGNLGNKAASRQVNTVLRETIDLGKDLQMIAELTPVGGTPEASTSDIIKQASNKAAETVKNELTNGIWYRVVIFDKDDEFVDTLDYKYNFESDHEPIFLTAGDSYTFVAYSVNSTNQSSLPTIDLIYQNETNSSNYKVSSFATQDLLFFKTTKVILSGQKNFLDIVFGHIYNEIITTIDVTETGYEMSGLSAYLNYNGQLGTVNLGTGDVTQNGTINSLNLTFTNNSANTIAKATSANVNLKGGNILTIASITIGTLTSTNIEPFPNVQLARGTKYNLNLKIVPSDELIIWEGQPAARINGQIWMRYNLGAPGNAIPESDPDTPGESIQGGYFQWGQNYAFADGTIGNQPNLSSFDNKTITDPNYYKRWNAGTETTPIKGDFDPCPVGYRLPVPAEYQSLIDVIGTSYRYIGTSNSSWTNYGYALQLISKKNKNVKLTFPAQGYTYIASDGNTTTIGYGGVVSRGTHVYARTSSYISNGTVVATDAPGVTLYRFRYQSFEGINAAPTIFTGPSSGPVSAVIPGHPVRCIAE